MDISNLFTEPKFQVIKFLLASEQLKCFNLFIITNHHEIIKNTSEKYFDKGEKFVNDQKPSTIVSNCGYRGHS